MGIRAEGAFGGDGIQSAGLDQDQMMKLEPVMEFGRLRKLKISGALDLGAKLGQADRFEIPLGSGHGLIRKIHR